MNAWNYNVYINEMKWNEVYFNFSCLYNVIYMNSDGTMGVIRSHQST